MDGESGGSPWAPFPWRLLSFPAILLRNSPTEKGLLPLGSVNESPGCFSDQEARSEKKSHGGTLVHLGLIFALFGATHVIYGTFIVTVLVNERGFGEPSAGIFWSAVGAFSIFSGNSSAGCPTSLAAEQV